MASAEAKHKGTSQTSSENSAVNTPSQNKSKYLKLPPIVTSSSQVSNEVELPNTELDLLCETATVESLYTVSCNLGVG